METPWPARPATPGDYPHFVRFFAELGVPEQPPDAAHWEAELLPGTIFLHRDGTPVAYALLRPLGRSAYVVHVVVDRAWRGRRLGGALMEAAADWLRRAGCVRWQLNVKVDNTPAVRLYERCGMRRTYDSTALSFPWEGLAALPREEAAVRAVDPADDAALEARFPLLLGRLAVVRKTGHCVIVELVDPGEPSGAPLGVAAFNPATPRAYPFVVARPALAAPLLEALRPHARPGDTFVRVTAEDDAALTAALVAAGATVTFELFRMEGDLTGTG